MAALGKYLRALAAALAAVIVAGAGNASAEPIAIGEGQGVTITLTDEPCALTDVVSNLPNRATWSEKGEVFEGCFTVHPAGVVVAYFGGG